MQLRQEIAGLREREAGLIVLAEDFEIRLAQLLDESFVASELERVRENLQEVWAPRAGRKMRFSKAW